MSNKKKSKIRNRDKGVYFWIKNMLIPKTCLK